MRKLRLYDWHQKILHFLKQKYLKVFICKQIKINLSRFPFKIKLVCYNEQISNNTTVSLDHKVNGGNRLPGETTSCLGRLPIA